MNDISEIRQKLLKKANELNQTKKKTQPTENIEKVNNTFEKNKEEIKQKRQEYFSKKKEERETLKKQLIIEKQEKLKLRLEKEIEKENPELKERINKTTKKETTEAPKETIREIIKEVPVIKEVIREVIKEVPVIKEVIREPKIEEKPKPKYYYPTNNYYDPFSYKF